MTSLAQINASPSPERDRCYLSVVPPALWLRFRIDPVTVTNFEGRPLARVEATPGTSSVRISIKHHADAVDPVFFAQLDDTRYGNLQISFIILNDPDGPRFGVDLDDEGTITDLGSRSRNLREEESAMRAGLSPGQIRPGLRMLQPTLDRLEALALRLGKGGLLLDAFYYHNALLYERHGFGYLAGQDRMEAIHRAFLPGGPLEARLDGSTPFRPPRGGQTIRGRSWAIHDRILQHPWWPPVMYRPIGIRMGICTAPGIPF